MMECNDMEDKDFLMLRTFRERETLSA